MKTVKEKRENSKWFAESANWFVLFARTKDERNVARRLNEMLDNEKFVAFVPTRDYVFRKKNMKPEMRKSVWLGSYVFVASAVGLKESAEVLRSAVIAEPNVYKALSYDGKPKAEVLNDRDKNLMMALLDESFNIPAIAATMAGDKIKFISEAFSGVESRVTKVNKNKQTAQVEMSLFNRRVVTEIALELVVVS